MQLTMPGFELPKYARGLERVDRAKEKATKPHLKAWPDPISDADVVHAVLTKRGDRTASEIASLCPLTTVEVTRRTGELAHAGRIKDTGERRKSALGRPSIVWSAT